MNRKKGKIILIIIFIVILVIEVCLLFSDKELKILNKVSKNDENNIIVNRNTKGFLKENAKYVADISKPYTINGLNFELVENSENASFYKISGLKNKEIEDEVNKKIQDKIKILEEKYKDSKKDYFVYNSISGNFANILSITFNVTFESRESTKEDLMDSYSYGRYNPEDSLNIDLNTGDELSLGDILLNDSTLKEVLVSRLTKESYESIGFVCGGGPCENPEPDYSVVEDAVFSVMSKYNNNDFYFYLDDTSLIFVFKNVYFPDPDMDFEVDDEVDYCKTYKKYYDEENKDEYYEDIICMQSYKDIFELRIDWYTIADEIIFFDKYGIDKDIYLNKTKEISRKLISESEDNINNSFELKDKLFIDYNLNDFELPDGVSEKVYKAVVKESAELRKSGFNVMNLSGDIVILNDKYHYVFYKAYSYNMDEEMFKKNKKDIYLNKFNRISYCDDLLNCVVYKYGYDFMKNYLYKDGYYFYIYNDTGREVSVRSILSDSYDFSEIIPSEWLKLGKYKTVKDLVNSAFIMVNDFKEFPDRLVILDNGYNNITLKYKGKSIVVADSYDVYDEMVKMLYK